jgi:Ni2+-binding GTPase involved in maturation of urease and hydrogenase
VKRGSPPRLIFIGGYLGAGKTTLVWEAAKRLMVLGKRVGIVTNDQAPDLVDTALLRSRGLQVEEVAGSCFCCNFTGLIRATKELRYNADVLLAEPVGSCTDLASTLLQPLRSMFESDFTHSPLTVLADPKRLRDVLLGVQHDLSEYTSYIYRMQLEEADIIGINKIDRVDSQSIDELRSLLLREIPKARLRFISCRMGVGIDQWLEEVVQAAGSAPKRIEVDYEVYALGELSLAWFNGDYRLTRTGGSRVTWNDYCRRLLSALQTSLAESGMPIGHVKLLLSTHDGFVSGSVTDYSHAPELMGDVVEASAAGLVLNARVESTPDELEGLIEKALDAVGRADIARETKRSHSKRPGIPQPEYRIV